MNTDQEQALFESVRMIEAHLERIADALEKVVPVVTEAPLDTGGAPTLNPTRGRLGMLADKQKETYDHTYRQPYPSR